MTAWKRKAANVLRRTALRLDPDSLWPSRLDRVCPVCGYHGPFKPMRRADAVCPDCGSAERHRLIKLVIDGEGLFAGKPRLLHVAPEPNVQGMVEPLTSEYVTADLMRDDVDLQINIEDTGLPDGRFDAVVCSHALEHVDDDRKALRELFRILTPGGEAIFMIPYCGVWERTYEDPAITDPKERAVHFLQFDHVRLHGRDFRDRVEAAGFELTEIVPDGAEVARHARGLHAVAFVARRPVEPAA